MSAIGARIVTRLQVEDFLYREAELLDQWQLDEWLALWTQDARYQVGPTGKADALTLAPETSLFLIADDRFRLEQRVIRMKKSTAHAEYPHSRTRHLYSNIRVEEDDGMTLKVVLNFATYRSARSIVNTYFGRIDCTLESSGNGDERKFKLAYKRVTLDLDSLVPHGRVTIFL